MFLPEPRSVFFCICNYLRGHKRAIAGAGFGHEMAAIRCADDGAAQRHDSINTFAIENNVIAGRKKPFKSVAKTNDVPAAAFQRPEQLPAALR